MRLLLLLMLGLVPPLAALASPAEAPAGFVVHDEPLELPNITFQDGAGNTRQLAEFRGRVVLLNVWATWCGPCRHEMPTLDRLQAALGGADFEVAALSIDRAGIEVVRAFYGEIGIEHLEIYIDRHGGAMNELALVGLPTTLLIDRSGREIGRLIGPAEWDAPELLEFLRGRVTEAESSDDVQ